MGAISLYLRTKDGLLEGVPMWVRWSFWLKWTYGDVVGFKIRYL